MWKRTLFSFFLIRKKQRIKTQKNLAKIHSILAKKVMNSESLGFPQTASLSKANQINFYTLYFKRRILANNAVRCLGWLG